MDLAALRTYLLGMGSLVSLAAGDAHLPPELRAFLATAPRDTLTVAPAAGGIALTGSTLSVTGTTSDTWPVPGLAAATLSLSSATLRVTDAKTPLIALTAAATMPLGGPPCAVTVASPTADAAPWTITLAADVHGVSPQALIELAFAAEVPFPIPAQLDVLTQSLVLASGDLSVAFAPGTPGDALLTFAISAPDAKLTLVSGVAELAGMTLRAALKSHSISLAVIGQLVIEGVQVDVGVGFSTGSVWSAFIAPPPGHAFPGITELANWLAGEGSSQGGRITSGLTNIGMDPGELDAAIEGVTLTFDVAARKLVALEVDSRLTVAALPLDITLKLPDLTVAGSLHAGAAVKVSDVLGALQLPAKDLPIDAKISAVRFSAEPSASAYMAELHVDDVAKAGPFDLDEISVLVSYSPAAGFDGRFDAQMSVWDLGAIDAGAEYSTLAGWTWSFMTPPGRALELGGIIAHLGTQFGLDAGSIPLPIRTLDLRALSMRYATGTSSFAFTFTGDFAIADVPVEIAPAILVEPVDPSDMTKGWRYDFGGTLTVAYVELALGFDTAPSSTTLVASLSATADRMPAAVDVAALVSALSPALGAEIPSGLVVDLKSAKLASIQPLTGPRTLALALDLGASIELSKLPLVGDRLPAGERVSIDDLQVAYASATITTEQVTLVNEHLPAGIRFPATGLARGPGFSATIAIADSREQLSLGLAPPLAQQASQLEAAPSVAVTGSTRRPGKPRTLAAALAGPAAPTAKWFDVQRRLGAVQFSRVGVLYDRGVLFFAIDAALALGPLTLSIDGLGVGSKLTAFSPEFTLAGAGLELDRPPLRIGGSFLRTVPPPAGTTFELDGSLVIEAEQFGLAAIGAYAVLDSGAPSLFAFGQLSAPLGGPAAFFVTGLMAGFGVNRTLAIPAPTEVMGFPLLVLNQPPQPGQPVPAQTLAHVLDVIEGRVPATIGGKARAWISPSPGSYWLAAGLTATHYELVQTRAVIVGETGNELALALLGLATTSLPQSADSSWTYAYAELELEAIIEPAEGTFGVTALLTPSSYVLVPACKLTGGFALDVWFGDSPHAGQFVLTLGGYHPAFKKPAYYPTVARLGFSWVVSSKTSIGGGAYLALTPSSVMAGGSLRALFHSGDLKASFTANADMLLSWRPFFFTATIDVEVAVSYRLNLLLCHKTIDVSLGASVKLWGPPTGGTVHVHLWCVSFTVSFGSHPVGTANDPLHWSAFASLLPAAKDVVSFQPTGGLTKSAASTHSTSGKAWMVRATAFSFTTESAVPASHLCYGVAAQDDPTSGAVSTAGLIDIKPMNLTGVTAVHRLIVRHGAPDAPPSDVSDWSLAARPRNVPDALWGAPPTNPFTQTPAQPKADLVTAQIGFAVTSPPPGLGATRGAFPLGEVAQELLDTTRMPLDPGATPTSAYAPVAAPHSIRDIAQVAGAAALRSGLVGALGDLYAGDDDAMTALGAQAATLFADAPMAEVTPA